MATHTSASAVFPLPITTVWPVFRDFLFPGRLISTIEACELVEGDGATCVGAERVIRWKTGEERRHRLLELSDEHYSISWNLVGANHPTETMSVLSHIRCFPITEDNTTLVEWSSDFSADVSPSVLKFEQTAYAKSLAEMRRILVENAAAPASSSDLVSASSPALARHGASLSDDAHSSVSAAPSAL
ncbi:uncharacterized protein AMSG_08003 [Thecamonas trahens ATCC 50062]|uniref:Uncharacterized protein n=1 Tax=Thecamonas trahens ATCC 50062 TaxID=461836 RepID=A0A0L0DKL6_THETB|nr:hypothetical protein AMSG_08003 [Thecamonas trahens ATCC 50062]KNC51903.1 hypothetical protein AMSG_08003 [Thecamonas trahens ATCC 50062]|eukprot:XP_013755759.1 hypothetical protein AMSG_08003 [Thecamonas trahens ATCC 50062]